MSTPLPAVPNTVRFRMTQTLGDDLNLDNILYATYGSVLAPLTAAQVQTLADKMFSIWTTRVTALQCSVLSLASVTCTDLDTITGFEQTSTHIPVAGSVGTQAVTAATSMVVTLKTDLRGRSFRGRQYLAGLPVSGVATAQTWGGTITTNFGTALSNVAGDLEIGAAPVVTMAICSFYSGTDATIPGRRPVPIRRITPVTTPVTSWKGELRIGSQRRRNR